MTIHEQKHFVRQLSHNIAEEIMAKIDKGLIPPEWNGHELRCLLADKHEESAGATLVRRNPRSKLARQYKNTKLINML